MGLFKKLLRGFPKRKSPLKRIIRNGIKETFKPITNQIKGEIGESKVDRQLNPLIFGKVEHRQINNLVLLDDRGKSHQIDHVEIRQNGIFCIETKNYIGWIFGSENQNHWTQSLYTGEKNAIPNPIKQNKSHIYHLSQALGKKYKINSLIVMANNNADKINCSNVINLCDLKSYLNSFDNGIFLSLEEMDNIYNKLISAAATISKSEHLANIKNTQAELKEKICPRCGGNLINRNGKYGSFYGCSNYPNCKFTLKK